MITQLLYIDPGATTAVVTAITGVVVAVGASAIVIWRKFKKKVDKAINKDPNANKEVEEELVITDDEVKTEESAEQTAENTEATEKVETVEAPVETAEPETEEKAPETQDKPKAKTKKQK